MWRAGDPPPPDDELDPPPEVILPELPSLTNILLVTHSLLYAFSECPGCHLPAKTLKIH